MSNDVVLSPAIRANLLSLQQISSQETTTQERLATGKKVNSALDNAVNYFTSQSLTERGQELSSLLDSMSNGVNTLNAASNGLTSITTTIQDMQAAATQALQDSSWQSSTYLINTAAIGNTAAIKTISFTGGAIGSNLITVNLNDVEVLTGASTGFGGTTGTTTATTAGTFTVQAADINNGNAISIAVSTNDTVSDVVTSINAAAGTTIASVVNGELQLTDPGNKITVGGSAGVATALGFGAGNTTSTSTAGTAEDVDQLVFLINNNPALSGYVKASDNAGQLQVTNLSTSPLSITGITTTSVDGTANVATIAGNAVRANLVTQFNQLKNQLDETANDASFNGVNLLAGDVLKLFFNEQNTSTLSIQSTNPNGVNSTTLGIQAATLSEFQSNTQLEAQLQQLQDALNQVASQASDFGSTLAIVQNRQDFTTNMINTLQTGADNLTLADTNEEGANMLALQTQQQLSITALSLASQAEQSVLKLFG